MAAPQVWDKCEHPSEADTMEKMALCGVMVGRRRDGFLDEVIVGWLWRLTRTERGRRPLLLPLPWDASSPSSSLAPERPG